MSDKPKHLIVALVFLSQNGSILLVRQNYGNKYWSLPGGIVESFESVEEAAIREVMEETGLNVKIKGVVGIYSKVEEDSIAITLAGEIISGSIFPSSEIDDCEFFQTYELPLNIRAHLKGRVEDFITYSGSAVIRVD